MEEKGNLAVTCALVAALVATLLVSIARSEGFRETRVDLHDGSVWVSRTSHVGRVNLEAGSIEVSVADPAKVDSDVIQSGTVAYIVNPPKGQLTPVDGPSARSGSTRELPAHAIVAVWEDRGMIVDGGTGRTWLAPADGLGAIDTETGGTDPTFELDEPAEVVAALDASGMAHVYPIGSNDLHTVDADGSSTTTEIAPLDEPTITAVGSRPVLMDSGELHFPGGSSVDLEPHGQQWAIQEPGPESEHVLVGTDEGLIAVPLGGGEPRTLASGGGESPVRPVHVSPNDSPACAFGAWASKPSWARWCEGEAPPVARRFEQARGGSNSLRFRVNRDRVVLNDVLDGKVLPVQEEEPEVIENWDEALDQDREPEEEEEVEQPEPPPCPETITDAPKTEPDRAGTRRDRPVIVSVIDNDTSLECDVLAVELIEDELPDDGVALVEVVSGGSAIQVTPLGDAKTIEVSHRVMGRGGATRSSLRVDVTPEGTNNPPVLEPDRTVVEAGRLVQHNVLLNDSDPDGDALTLVGVGGGSRGGVVSFEANGRVSYTAPGGAVGIETLTYYVDDHHAGGGDLVEGELEIRIQSGGANQAPKARNDRIVATVGVTASADLLVNDTDPNGDELVLLGVDEELAEGLAPSTTPDGVLTITPTRAGRFWFPYEVGDDEHTVQAWVLADVGEEGANSAPVAVRDDVVVRPGVPALVDLVANDIDDDGDVLAVTDVEVLEGDGSEISIEILEMRVARVTTSAALSGPAIVRYTVSDGRSSDDGGRLIIRPLLQSIDDQAPIARDDTGSVRPGNTTSVAVLRNDIDPEGEQLVIEDVRVAEESDGTAFIQGDQIRFQASDDARGTVLVEYDVVDPAGNSDTATVRIEVIDPSRDNQPPASPWVEGRVFAGGEVRVGVPLTGLDPDGDVVGITGLTAEGAPRLGSVAIDGGALVYRAHEGADLGVDEFVFEVADPHGASAFGRARVVVAPRPLRNSPPVAVPDRITLSAGTSRIVPVLDNDRDADGDELRLLDYDLEGPSQPRLGRAEVAADGLAIEYTAPGAGELDGRVQQVAFTYGVTDGPAASRGIVLVEIHPTAAENEPPVAVDDHLGPQLAGTKGLVIDVLANDRDVDDEKEALTVELIGGSSGRVGEDGRITVDLGDTSTSLLYRLTDPAGGSSIALVSIPVVAELPPVPETAAFEVPAGETRRLDLSAHIRNPMGPTSELTILRELERTVRGGKVTGIDGLVVEFTAAREHAGDGGFAYLVTNGPMEAVGSVRVRVTGTSHPPEVRHTEVSLPENGTRRIDLSNLVIDPDSDEHTFALIGGDRPGTIDLDLEGGGTLVVSAGATAKGEVTAAELTVADERDEPVSFTIDVSVDPNEAPPPIANDDSAETDEGNPVTISVLDNDIDPAGEGLTVRGGTLQVAGGTGVGSATTDGETVTFTPARGWFGTALITYRVVDISEREATGTIRVEVYGRPGRPSAPSGEPDSHQVRLGWGAPSRNGSPITGYVVETEGRGRETTPNATSWTVTGLQNGTGYRFRVAALNRVVTAADQVRADEWSEWSPTYTPDAVPEQPSAPTAEFRNEENAGGAGGVLHVSWRAPSVDGTPITQYRVTVSPAPEGQSATRSVPAAATSLAWEGLTNGTPYRFRVVAVNAAGESLPSPDSPPSIPAGLPAVVGTPSAERVVSTENDLGGYAVVSWPQAGANGDPEGLRYRVTASPAPPGGQPATRETSDTAMEWSGLSVDQRYTFSVVAVNKAGPAAASGPSSQVVPEGKPDAPSSPGFLPGDGGVEISGLTLNDEQSRGPGTVTYQVRFGTGAWNTLSVNGGRAVRGAPNGIRIESVHIRACKFGLGGGPERQCSRDTAATNSSTGAGWVVPFGAPAVTGSPVAGTGQIRWSWAVPSGASSSPNSPHVVDYGPGHPRSQTQQASISWQGVTRNGTGTATTADTRAVSWSAGGSASGQTYTLPTPGTCGEQCRWASVSIRGFVPGATYTLLPGSSMTTAGAHDPNFEGCIASRVTTFTTDANGNADLPRAWFQGDASGGQRAFAWVYGVVPGSQSDCQARGTGFWWYPSVRTPSKMTL